MTAWGAVPVDDPISDYLGGTNMTAVGEIPVTAEIEDYGEPDPAVLTPPVAGYIAHHDASDPAEVTLTNEYVSQLDDKSGNGRHLTPIGTTFPALCKRAFAASGRNGVALAGGTAMACTVPANDRTETLFVVAIRYAAPGDGSLIGCQNDGRRQVRISAGQLQMIKAGVSVMLGGGPTVPLGTPFVVATRMDATTIKLWRDLQTPVSGSNSTTFDGAGNSALAQKLDSGDRQLYHRIYGEFIAYDTALSDGDVDTTIDYLMDKWAIT